MKLSAFSITVILGILPAFVSNSALSDAPCPTAGETLPGCVGSIDLDLLTGDDTFWTDTDGVNPFAPGCHYEWKAKVLGANGTYICAGRIPPVVGGTATPQNRLDLRGIFGELCYTDTILVESNPEAGVCHRHIQDRGGPYLWDCQVLCNAHGKQGKCEEISNFTPPGETESCHSAKCVCT